MGKLTPAQLDALLLGSIHRTSIETGLSVQQIEDMARGRMPTTDDDIERLRALLKEKQQHG